MQVDAAMAQRGAQSQLHLENRSPSSADALLLLDDDLEPLVDLSYRQRAEAETRAARLNCWRDFVDVVADDAEADILGVLLDDCRRGGGVD
jgi:hypothetical protein